MALWDLNFQSEHRGFESQYSTDGFRFWKMYVRINTCLIESKDIVRKPLDHDLLSSARIDYVFHVDKVN